MNKTSNVIFDLDFHENVEKAGHPNVMNSTSDVIFIWIWPDKCQKMVNTEKCIN